MMERMHWMYKIKRHTPHYLSSLEDFLRVANDNRVNMGESYIRCPCVDCNNNMKFAEISVVQSHLITRGFMPNYVCWSEHGELSVDHNTYVNDGENNDLSMDNDENHGFSVFDDGNVDLYENDDLFLSEDEDYDLFGNGAMGDDLFGDVDENDDWFANEEQDNLDDMFLDLEDNVAQKDYEKLQELFMDSKRDLYKGCKKYTKLSAVLKLFNLKSNYGWSDKSFKGLLEVLHDILPEDNLLPVSFHEAKKLICPMGMKVEKIHACPNDCILYRNEYKDLHECIRCSASRYKVREQTDESSNVTKKPPPAKVLWYFPIVPRLKRLFANPRDAKLLRWHAEGRKIDGKLRHVADSPQWSNIDFDFQDFGAEIRNLRLGLSSDGINPFGNMSSRHSTWPVLLCIYNLPPWLCMKRKYIMMSLLIQGPKQPGNDIDVYLAPLIDDLKKLWSKGVEVFDAYKKEFFQMRAMIFCTISDFPAYGNLSGYSTKGKKACPVCEEETSSYQLKNCKKTVYMGHRRSLPDDHPYRKQKRLFDNTIEKGKLTGPIDGETAFSRVENLDIVFGKKTPQEKGIWKKRSIFWDLPYWKHLEVRHCLDVMHIEKNVCESLIGLLLNISGKTKDGINVRKDMVDWGIRKELAPIENDGKRVYLPAACYTMSKDEKEKFCRCLHGVKVPSGYSANIKKLVSMKDHKLLGMKSHDCHVLMTQMIPIAIRGILPDRIRHTITKLCLFFNMIHSKVIDPEMLDSWQSDIILTLCQLEMYFPPSFFDVMVHLVSHIVGEIKACGPVFLRYMYPFERYMGFLKGYVRNRYRPEGSIVEGYASEEVIEFCTDYLEGFKSIGIPERRHEGRLQGAGTIGEKKVVAERDDLHEAHFTVLQHMTCIAPYVHEHMTLLKKKNSKKSDKWLATEHNRTFSAWLKSRVREGSNGEDVDELVKSLADGPNFVVAKYQGYDINGYTFYTKQQDEKSAVQNSGVTVIASTTEYFSTNHDVRSTIAKNSYYGVIQEIWELNYGAFNIPMFKCKWVENQQGVKLDKDGFTTVNLSTNGYVSEPFILAKQATQVFFVKDPKDSRWHIALHGKRRIVGVEDVVDEEEYDQFDELPPFSVGIPSSDDNINDTTYLRSDHNEGVWIVEP